MLLKKISLIYLSNIVVTSLARLRSKWMIIVRLRKTTGSMANFRREVAGTCCLDYCVNLERALPATAGVIHLMCVRNYPRKSHFVDRRKGKGEEEGSLLQLTRVALQLERYLCVSSFIFSAFAVF